MVWIPIPNWQCHDEQAGSAEVVTNFPTINALYSTDGCQRITPYMYTAISVPFFSEASILFLHYVFLHAFRYQGVVMDLSGRSPALLLCPVRLALATVFSWVIIIMHETGSSVSS